MTASNFFPLFPFGTQGFASCLELSRPGTSCGKGVFSPVPYQSVKGERSTNGRIETVPQGQAGSRDSGAYSARCLCPSCLIPEIQRSLYSITQRNQRHCHDQATGVSVALTMTMAVGKWGGAFEGKGQRSTNVRRGNGEMSNLLKACVGQL